MEYGDVTFWDNRYSADERATFDWLQTYDMIRDLLIGELSPESEILIVGCGNSRLGESLYEDGFHNITNIDISGVVIEQMRRRYIAYEEMEWTEMDCTKMTYPSQCFDVIIDKATLDTLLCGGDSFKRVTCMLHESHRLLKPGGRFMMVSYGVPATRLGYLKARSLDWDVEYTTLEKPAVDDFDYSPSNENHFFYLCRKPVVSGHPMHAEGNSIMPEHSQDPSFEGR